VVLIVACVEVGDYLGRGKDYVRRLRSMVSRHLSAPHKFVVITDNHARHAPMPPRDGDFLTLDLFGFKHLQGWWAKLAMFAPGYFPQGARVLYLDLDTVIVGSIDRLAEVKGILHLADWGWQKNDFGSGVMAWDTGEHAEIWERFTPDVPQRFRGDQDWMTHLGGWPALPKGLCVSYRYLSREAPPAGASVVCFHGKPKPHELAEGWVPKHWG
jgi:hypothetical protein